MFSSLSNMAVCVIVLATSANLWSQTSNLPDDPFSLSATQVRLGLDPATPLIERYGVTPDSVLTIFRDAGMSPTPYALSEKDRQSLAEAISILPPLHQRVLQQHLRTISLVENMPNTALTSTVNPSEPFRLFDITIRAAILHQTAAEWIAEKEGSCFEFNNSLFRLQVDVGTISALQYVLLHEATHVVDSTKDITPSMRPTPDGEANPNETPFTAGIWEDPRKPRSPFQDARLMMIRFRPGGRVLPAEEAKDVYLALGKTPFVSLYGSCARTEDLAEYVTVYHLTQKLKQPYRITILDGEKKVLVHEPMASDTVRGRYDLMKQFYELQDNDG